MEAISRESYLAFAGLKKTAELQPIYKQYEGIFGTEALELTLDAFRAAPENSDDKRSAQALLEWEIESQASKPLAALDEREIEWENTAIVRSPDGRVIQYQAAPIEIANTGDRVLRLALDEARARLVAKGARAAPPRAAPAREGLHRIARRRRRLQQLVRGGDGNIAGQSGQELREVSARHPGRCGTTPCRVC